MSMATTSGILATRRARENFRRRSLRSTVAALGGDALPPPGIVSEMSTFHSWAMQASLPLLAGGRRGVGAVSRTLSGIGFGTDLRVVDQYLCRERNRRR